MTLLPCQGDLALKIPPPLVRPCRPTPHADPCSHAPPGLLFAVPLHRSTNTHHRPPAPASALLLNPTSPTRTWSRLLLGTPLLFPSLHQPTKGSGRRARTANRPAAGSAVFSHPRKAFGFLASSCPLGLRLGVVLHRLSRVPDVTFVSVVPSTRQETSSSVESEEVEQPVCHG